MQRNIVVGTQTDKKLLTKTQKDFNRLTKRVETLRWEIELFERATPSFQQKMAKEIEPLTKKYDEERAELVMLFDRAHDSGFFKKKEQNKLAHLIKELALYLITQSGFDTLKPTYDKYSDIGIDAELAESEEGAQEFIKSMITQMYGIEIEEDADLSTIPKMEEYVHQKMHEQAFEAQEKARERARLKEERPKTAKQLEKEAKQKLEEARQRKSIRDIYMDLVKAFHPDRELDLVEKDRKTAIMQRITEAYEGNDLMTLLQLQLEFERIDQNRLEGLADDQLRYYNKILLQQTRELEGKLMGTKEHLSHIVGFRPPGFTHPDILNFYLEREKKELKKNIKALKSDLSVFADKNTLKAMLKDYEIPKDDDFGFFNFG